MQLLKIQGEGVLRIACSRQPRATADFLARTLTEGCRIGEASMIENVIGIDARDAHAESVEGNILKLRAVDAISHAHLPQFVVTTRTAVVEIDAHLRRIDAEVNLALRAVAEEVKILQVERVAEEYPSPPEVGANLDALVRGKRDALAVATQYEVLVITGGLHHDREFVMLWFYIVILQTIEAPDGLLHGLSHLFQHLFVLAQRIGHLHKRNTDGHHADGHHQQ